MDEIEEIKQRIDLVDLVSQYVTVKKAGANYKSVCPFHEEKTPSMMTSPQKQIWKCFGCGRGGDCFKFIMEAEHLEFGDALRLLAQKAGVTLKSKTSAEHQSRDRKETLYRINELCARIFSKVLLDLPDGKKALEYLKKRGLTDETIKKYRVGFAPRNFFLKQLVLKKGVNPADLAKAGSPDKFFNRIIFPIFDVLGNIVGFTGRILGEGEPKYLNTPETPLYNKSRILYGLNFAKKAISQKNYIVLVEGQMDVIALHQAGVEQAVASSGTAFTETQLQILSKYTNNFLLAFDNDSAGRIATKKVVELLLKNDLNGKVIDFGKYKDAGELFEQEPKKWGDLVKNAVEELEWCLRLEMAAVGDVQFIENKKVVVKAMLPLLKLVSDPTRLDHYLQKMTVELGVRADSLYASLSKISAPAESLTQPSKKDLPRLTNEEQLLAILMAQPSQIKEIISRLKEVVWQSVDAQTVAKVLMDCYTDQALVKNQVQFYSRIKNTLGSPLAEKIDSWQFWLSQTWPEFSVEFSRELAIEKLGQLSTLGFERSKEKLASEIRQAQVKGDIKAVKELMKKLTIMSKEEHAS